MVVKAEEFFPAATLRAKPLQRGGARAVASVRRIFRV